MIEALAKYFTELVEIKSVTQTQGDFGEIINTTEVKGELLGQLENQSGTERVTQDKETVFRQYTFYCLTPSFEILESDELHYNGKIYDITNVENVQNRNRVMQIDCELRI